MSFKNSGNLKQITHTQPTTPRFICLYCTLYKLATIFAAYSTVSAKFCAHWR